MRLAVDSDALGDAPAHHRPLLVLAVAAGGVVGTLLRYAIGLWLPTMSGAWPVATLMANLIGAFVLGALLEALGRAGPDAGGLRLARLSIGTGVCGGLTTYSTFAVETDLLVRADRLGLAVAYAAVTVTGGLAASIAGVVVSARTRQGRAG